MDIDLSLPTGGHHRIPYHYLHTQWDKKLECFIPEHTEEAIASVNTRAGFTPDIADLAISSIDIERDYYNLKNRDTLLPSEKLAENVSTWMMEKPAAVAL